jgi:hypothetical protein
MGRSRRTRVLLPVAVAVLVSLGVAALAYPVVAVETSGSMRRPGGTAPGAAAPPRVAAGSPATASQPGATSPATPTAGTTTPPPIGAPPFPAPAGKRWRVAFSEEFNNGGYDRTKLTPCFDWNNGDCTVSFNNGREYYDPAQVRVSGGTAKLVAEPSSTPKSKPACRDGRCTYKAGLLSTARADAGSDDYLFRFTYGYVESRFKFPATQGFFTAFWMLPADPSFSYRSEIDILEVLGDDPTTMFMTYHYDNRGTSFNANKGKYNNGACAVKNYANNFVRMGVDWQPNRIAWYIDGVRCAEFTNAGAIENGPMQLILHMMVDNDWQQQWNVGLKDPTLARQLEVDYIRVFQAT